jgi:hypothetical protein
MKFIDFIARNEIVYFKDIIPLLQQIYFAAHNWNTEDTVINVFTNKRKHVYEILLAGVRSGSIIGDVVEDYIYDDFGDVCEFHPLTGEPVIEVKLGKSYANLASVIRYTVADLKDLTVIPPEMLRLAGIDAKLCLDNSTKQATTTLTSYNNAEVADAACGELQSIPDVIHVDYCKATELSDEEYLKNSIEGLDTLDLMTKKQKQELGMLRLKDKKSNITIVGAVKAGLYYASLKEGDVFDKDVLTEKIVEWECSKITDVSIDLIYRALPDTHKRGPGEKKIVK